MLGAMFPVALLVRRLFVDLRQQASAACRRR
jgi:hypothetical protein